MLQANPSLTPNAVKAVLQYTAQVYPAYDPMTEGAGFLNAAGAVSLANFLASPATVPFPDSTSWSGQIIWAGNLVSGGLLTADANAWPIGVDWGATYANGSTPIGWGVTCASGCDTGSPQWVAWQSNNASGTSSDGDTVVWGTSGDGDTVVWGTSDDGDTVVWGTSCSDSSCDPVVWQGQ